MNRQPSKISQRARLVAMLLGILILGVAGQTWLINNYLLSSFQRLESSQLDANANLIRLWLENNYLRPLSQQADKLAGSPEFLAATGAGGPHWVRLLETAREQSPSFGIAALVEPDGNANFVGLGTAPAPEPDSDEAKALLHSVDRRDEWVANPSGLLATAMRPLGRTGRTLVLGQRFSRSEQDFLQELSGTQIRLVEAAERVHMEPSMASGRFRRGGEGNRQLEICDSYGAPGTGPRMMCMQLKDSIYLRGKASVDDLRLATLIGFALLILVAWLFMDRALLRRLQHLVEQLRSAKEVGTEALEKELVADSLRNDELGQLSGGMGQLLAQVRLGETELRQQQENFRSLTESTGVGIFVLKDRIIYANPFAERITGYTFLELLEKRLPDLVHPNDRTRIETRIQESEGIGHWPESTEDEVRGRTKDGGHYWARLHTVSLYYQGEPAVLVTLYDTSEQRHLQAAIAREKERLQVILSSIQDGIVSLDAQGRVNYLNTAAERLIGHTVDSALGKHLREVALFADPLTQQALPHGSLDNLTQGGSPLQAIITTPTGDRRDVELKRSPMLSSEGGDRPGSVVVLRDVSELRRMTRHLEHQASHDELTGLFNRREFNNRLRDALTECRRSGTKYALCYMDLDQFKTVNDICGHQAGDQMLKQITGVVQQHIREGDTIARLGGDEFGMLLRCSAEEAEATANQVRRTISDVRFAWGGRTFTVDASVGIAMLDQIKGELDEALSIVDATCYMAKEEGRNRVRVYRPGDVDLQRQFGQMRWAQRLKDSLDQEQFLLFQQGIHPLNAGDEVASEVLVRLRDASGRIINAGDFLDAAERYQMMPALDRFIVQTALTHMIAERSSKGRIDRTYFVNLSGHSLGDEAFHTFLLDCFSPQGSELTPHLVFEVTETSVISSFGKARRLMQELRNRGCRFALDDFGTGMSSFAYLKELDVQFLKIAGQFVRNLPRDKLDQTIVRNFTNFGKQLGLKIIAEWVEDAETLELLREMGVDYAQGFGLDKPAPLAIDAPVSALRVA